MSLPKHCGTAKLYAATEPTYSDVANDNATKQFAILKTLVPVMETKHGLALAVLHRTAFSTKTGEPIGLYDLRHRDDDGRRVSDRFIFTTRRGDLVEVEHLSRIIKE